MCRALYAQADLTVLDDVLSAVDARVGEAMFRRLMRLEDTTLVASLNQLERVRFFDHVIVMKNNSVVEHGGFEELFGNESSELRRLMKEAGTRNNSAHNASLASPQQQQQAVSQTARRRKILSEKSTTALVLDEKRSKGQVSSRVVKRYVREMGKPLLAASLFLGASAYALMALNDFYLAYYLDRLENGNNPIKKTTFAIVYSIGTLLFLVSLVGTSYMFSRAGVRSSKLLHHEVVSTLMHAPLEFFESTPSGRILSRFSTDLGVVDHVLSRFVDNFYQFICTLTALIVLTCVLVPSTSAVIAVSAILFGTEIVAVDRCNRETKRCQNERVAPLQSLLSAECLEGKDVVRAYGVDGWIHKRYCLALDKWSRISFFALSATNFGMGTSYALSFAIAISTGLFLITFMRDSIAPSEAGLALNAALTLPYFALHLSFIIALLQMALASLERLLQFSGDENPDVPREAEWYSTTPPPPEWPSRGDLTFENVCLRYRKDLPNAVEDVSFDVAHGTRVGVVGRTGAGKSSLVLLMLRVREPTSGRILLDGLDTSKVGVLELRKKFAVIPQRPLLLKGSVRLNLDPFEELKDENVDFRMAQALIKVGLSDSIEDALGELDRPVGVESAGERQLLTMARTLLRPVKIVVMDEASSNVDAATDSKLTKTLTTEFSNATVLVVAHRLKTVISADRICVMEKGRVCEWDSPLNLLRNEDSLFHGLASAAGPAAFEELVAAAASDVAAAR